MTIEYQIPDTNLILRLEGKYHRAYPGTLEDPPEHSELEIKVAHWRPADGVEWAPLDLRLAHCLLELWWEEVMEEADAWGPQK